MGEQSQFDRGKFEGEVLSRLASIDDKLNSIIVTNSKLDDRVRKLENFRYWTLGAAAAVGGLAGLAIKLLIK